MNRFYLVIWMLFMMKVSAQDPFALEREKMVTSQIQARGIADRETLHSMRKTPRHLFVPEEIKDLAYEDRPLPIGEGQTISQPYIVAYMTQIIRPDKNFRVLEIGTGSGYQAAVLSPIVDSVFTIEIIEKLFLESRERFKSLGYQNIQVKNEDGYHGWVEKGPFDAIVVTAAAEFVPPPLIEQLKEGGRMIIPVGTPFSVQQLLLVEKKKGKVRSKNLMFVRFVPFTRSE